MSDSRPAEGYVFTSYGDEKYLRDTIVAANTIRRYDKLRPIFLYCSPEHDEKISEWGLKSLFPVIEHLPEENRSITGYKHNLHKFMPYQANMYLDSDMIWCRNPDALWQSLKPFPYTITGQNSADVFFGAPKGWGIVRDLIFRRRQRTLRRFALTFLYRVQSGLIFASDYETTKKVNEQAAEYLSRQDETHFISRKNEAGRSLESCEWSLGMALSKLNLFVYPWFNGFESPQQDYIHDMVKANEDFTEVSMLYYCNPFIQSLRGINSTKIRNFWLKMFDILPRSQDRMWITPYVLHFGWGHQKKYWRVISDRLFETFVPSQKK